MEEKKPSKRFLFSFRKKGGKYGVYFLDICDKIMYNQYNSFFKYI